MFKEKSNTKFLLFYFVIIYLFAFIVWWSFLLYSRTQQHYSDMVNYKSLQYEYFTGNNQIDYMNTEDFKKLDEDFSRQKLMIVTEGIVFFIILLIGIHKVYNSFTQELDLARQQKNFLLSITHELKSPLSSIKLVNETLKKRDLGKEKQNQLLDNSLVEVNRLENLVENILITAKIDNNKFGFHKEEINLSTLCNQITSNYSSRSSILFESNITPDILINGDKVCLSSIINNLIENAIKYAPKEKITLELFKENNKTILQVKDTGTSIPESEKTKIFDKFYRIGNEETRKAKGTGLGLYIVKQLVQFHKGKIKVENNNPKGNVFKITF